MPDPLFLSLWFPNFERTDMLPLALGVMRYFPFSAQKPGITYLAVHPVSWSEPTVLEQRFNPGVRPEEAVLLASDLLHEDHAYVFEAFWDLWMPASKIAGQDVSSADGDEWTMRPSQVRFLVHGVEFDDGFFQEAGHVEVDFGLDTSFLYEGIALTPQLEENVRANVQKLVEFVSQVEKHSTATGRLLWSESGENLAQKLIARLQKIQ
jgi:hypothetical protein